MLRPSFISFYWRDIEHHSFWSNLVVFLTHDIQNRYLLSLIASVHSWEFISPGFVVTFLTIELIVRERFHVRFWWLVLMQLVSFARGQIPDSEGSHKWSSTRNKITHLTSQSPGHEPSIRPTSDKD